MCLVVDHKATEELRKALKNGEKRIFYKVLYLMNYGKLYSPYQYQKYKLGENVANWESSDCFGLIYSGALHAFVDEKQAHMVAILLNSTCNYIYRARAIVIQFECDYNTFIALGENDDVAVNSIYISEENYKKALAKPI